MESVKESVQMWTKHGTTNEQSQKADDMLRIVQNLKDTSPPSHQSMFV